MSRIWIVEGDATSSGGRVITSSQWTEIDGKGVARVNDMATCPLHNGVFPIVDGDPTTIIDGHPVALHGSKLSCGCTVLAGKQFRVLNDVGASADAVSDDASVTAAMAVRSAADTRAAAEPSAAAAASVSCDEAFILLSELTGKPLVDRQYKVVRESGAVEQGTTDEEGRTQVVASDSPEVLYVEIGEERVDA